MKILFAFWVVLFFPVAFSGCYMQSGRHCVLSNVKLVQVDTVWRYNGRKIRLTWEAEGNSLQYVTYDEPGKNPFVAGIRMQAFVIK